MSARTFDFCTRASREASPLACRTSSSSQARSKWSSSDRLFRPVMTSTSDSPAATASSTTYWIAGLSTTGSISFGVAFVAGKNRVPRPAAGITALVTAGPSGRCTSASCGAVLDPAAPSADAERVLERLVECSVERVVAGRPRDGYLGEAPAVPTGALGGVEGGVGGAQDLARRPPVVGEGRDAGGDRDLGAAAADGEGTVPDGPHDP